MQHRDVLQAIISASRIPSLSRQQYSLKRTRGGDLQGIMLDAGHIIHVPSVVHPELPPESLSAFSAVPNAPFEPADQANHESIMPLSNYEYVVFSCLPTRCSKVLHQSR